MSKDHAEHQNEEEIRAELAYLKEHFDEEYAEQSKERDEYFTNPANEAEIADMFAKMRLTEELYKARESAGLTQQELADRMKTNQTYIAAIERGRKNVTLATLARYAHACGKTLKVSML